MLTLSLTSSTLSEEMNRCPVNATEHHFSYFSIIVYYIYKKFYLRTCHPKRVLRYPPIC
ncbi:Uncharacterised protein [Segatella copri]|nr:Uncharacterised protein [Segatella copri]